MSFKIVAERRMDGCFCILDEIQKTLAKSHMICTRSSKWPPR